jgi:hypothetical protein
LIEAVLIAESGAVLVETVDRSDAPRRARKKSRRGGAVNLARTGGPAAATFLFAKPTVLISRCQKRYLKEKLRI